VLAVHALALAQAAELRAREGGAGDLAAAGFAAEGRRLWAAVRRVSAPLDADRPLSDEVTALAAALERDDVLLGGSPFLA
jgi:histidine ammonia-lyase